MTDKLLRISTVKEITGKSRSAIYADMAKGCFPESIHIGARSVAWAESAISAWVKAKIEAPRQKLDSPKPTPKVTWSEDGNNDAYWESVNAGRPSSEQI